MSDSPRHRRDYDRQDHSRRHGSERDRKETTKSKRRRDEADYSSDDDPDKEWGRHHERRHGETSRHRDMGGDRPHHRQSPHHEPAEREQYNRSARTYHGQQRPSLDQGIPEIGSIHVATVQNIRPFGLFVELQGYRRHGLVHNSQVSEEVAFSRDDEDEAKVKAMEFFAPVGSKVWVKVVELQEGGGPPKINCSMKVVSQEDGTDLDPRNEIAGRAAAASGFRGPVSESPPEVGTVVAATVASVKPYGIFVRLKGFRANGLVHLSQVSEHLDIGRDVSDEEKIAELSAVHAVGDPLFVKVVEVVEGEPGGRGPKVACSIKLVDQRHGSDLDPHNTKWQPRGEGPSGQANRGPMQPSADIKQGGTVEWGYLKAGDRQYGEGDKQYDLIGDDVLAALPPPPPPAAMMAQHNGHSAAEVAAGPSGISSVEEAMAILQKYKKEGKKKKKDKMDKKRKKEKKEKKKKDKRKKKDAAGSSGSDSDKS